ncbi:hypothetical protein ACYPKM_00140 [Pseudomonas aeruginosa]
MRGVSTVDDVLLRILNQGTPQRSATPVSTSFPAALDESLRNPVGAVQSSLSSLAGEQSGKLPSHHPYPAQPSSVSVVLQLNKAAQSIGELLQHFEFDAAATIIRIPTLLPQAGRNAELLARNLKAAVESSGLFYESHLARSDRGQYSFENLQYEPQYQYGQGKSETLGGWLKNMLAADPTGQSSAPFKMMRNQLEILAHPVLRLEGNVVPIIPAEIIMRPLYRAVEEVAEEGKPEATADNTLAWEIVMRLHHRRFGFIEFRLRWTRHKLSIVTTSPSHALVEYFRRDRNLTSDSLKICGDFKLVELAYNFDASRQHVTPMSFNTDWDSEAALTHQAHSTNPYDHFYNWDDMLIELEEKGAPKHLKPELVPMLSSLDLDSRIPSGVYGVLVYLAIWTGDQLPYLV